MEKKKQSKETRRKYDEGFKTQPQSHYKRLILFFQDWGER
jgi:hypothetical protein